MSDYSLFEKIRALRTEQINSDTLDIDNLSVIEILEKINNEDRKVPDSVRNEINSIEKAVNLIVDSFRKGGRLIYIGAGTSGRLGILDAAECPPTFGTSPDMVVGLIAGGKEAVFKAQEGAEDSELNGVNDLKSIDLNSNDTVCGIAASGRTPYVIGGLNYAVSLGSHTIFLSASSKEHIEQFGVNCDVVISTNLGAEVIAGSTRMKAGTAQKLILNMLTTCSMVRIGKTLGNVMIDLQLTNKKLHERAKRIIMDFTGIDYYQAAEYLEKTDGNVKKALVMILADADLETAENALKQSDGFVKQAINLLNGK